jgi:CCR4-NOT complex subunit CAF16
MLGFIDGWSQERCDMLIERFGVDLDWRVNQLSDGRKRRVQLTMAFLQPAKVVLLDEVTTDLDVLARQSLLDFVKEVHIADY